MLQASIYYSLKYFHVQTRTLLWLAQLYTNSNYLECQQWLLYMYVAWWHGIRLWENKNTAQSNWKPQMEIIR